jgi:hypothetical protein
VVTIEDQSGEVVQVQVKAGRASGAA